MKRENLFATIPEPLPQEWVGTLLQGDGLQLDRIVTQWHRTPRYDQGGGA